MFLLSQSNMSSSSYSTSSSPFMNIHPGVIIAIIAVSFIVALLIFSFLVQRKKAPRNGFLKWLREYLNFRSILISGIIKFVYLFLAIVTTALGILVMFLGEGDMLLTTIGIGFAIVIFGNLILRIFLETIMIMIGMWDNTSDIRAVLVEKKEAPEVKVSKKDAPKAPKESEKPEDLVAPEEPEAPREPIAPKAPVAPKATNVPVASNAPIAPKASEAPKAPEAPEPPIAPKAPTPPVQ